MAEELLDGANIIAGLQQTRGKTVAKGMAASPAPDWHLDTCVLSPPEDKQNRILSNDLPDAGVAQNQFVVLTARRGGPVAA